MSASLVHHYDDPRDAVTAPHKFMALTHYYVDRWLPELGERGHIIVTVLRRMGYLDRARDVERGGIEIEQEELAVLCGLKLRTLQREFAAGENGRWVNPALHLFVQREKQYHRNGAGRILREKTVYVVQMRDPLHPGDQADFQEECQKREKGESGRSRQIGGNGDGRSRQFGGETRQSDARSRQSDVSSRQFGGYLNKEILDSELPLETPDTLGAAPEFFASLFPENVTEKAQEGTDILATLSPDQWAALETEARGRVIAEKGDPIRTLAKQGKAIKDVKIMMRQMLAERTNAERMAEEKRGNGPRKQGNL